MAVPVCPNCFKPLKQMNLLFVVTPAGWVKFDKTGLRSKEVHISGAKAGTTVWCDNCGAVFGQEEESHGMERWLHHL